MAKRVIALALCVVMICLAFAGCAKKDDEDLGAYIQMYLTDIVYNMDPALAYENESNLKVVSLLFDNLFVLGENGKVQKSLAKSYKIEENEQAKEYKMFIELKDTCWTDGTAISANDVVFAWKRILEMDTSSEFAPLLFDIKNARSVSEGESSIDDLGAYAVNETTVEIVFEGKIDYDQFILNLTSYALVPLREDIVTKTEDWAKKPSLIVTSGPFRMREISYVEGAEKLILERNTYYYRDIYKDALDKSVKPYRLVIDYSLTAEEIMALYENGELFFVGDIPLSVRGSYKDKAEITDALSTHTYVLNENAIIRYYNPTTFADLSTNASLFTSAPDEEGRVLPVKNQVNGVELVEGTDGDKIFAIPEVRKALSLAIDRNAIADAVVFAKAATGLVPYGVFDADSVKKSFREVGGSLVETSANVDAAKKMLADAGVDAGNYMFAISVASYDDVHVKIAEMVKASWEALGFHVAVNAVDHQVNDDLLKSINDIPKDIRDDVFLENYKNGIFEVAAVDQVAPSADAFSVLAKYAKKFSGQALTMVQNENGTDYELSAHISGYDDEEFNNKIEDAFNQKDIVQRAILLHEAEKMLLEDMPVIPVIFNQNAILQSKDLSKIKASYYLPAADFKKAKLKNYEDYLPAETT